MKKTCFMMVLILLWVTVGCSTAATEAPSVVTITPARQMEAPRTNALVLASPAAKLPAVPPVTNTTAISATTTVSDTAQTALKTPIFGFFYADWCPTCKKMQPTIETLKDEYAGRIRVALLNVDDPQTRQVAAAYRVWAVPFMVLVKPNAELANQWIGEVQESALRTAFDDLLKQK